jgi:hypothetical protein
MEKGDRESSGSLGALAKKLAAQFESYKRSRAGLVTETSRGGFWINRGASDGIMQGLDAEVVRLRPGAKLGQNEIARALAEPDFFAGALAEQTAPVTRARVVQVYPDSAQLRYAYPIRGRKVKTGDIVEFVGARPSLFVGGISGDVPAAAADALRHLLVDELGAGGTIRAIPAPHDDTGTSWSRGEPSSLCEAAAAAGCDVATAGTAYFSGDSMHVAMGLVDVFSCSTVRLISASIRADPVLLAMASQGRASGARAQEPHGRVAEEGIGTCIPYETGLRPAFKTDLQRRALAAFVISDARALCVAYETSIEIYAIDSAGRSLTNLGRYDLTSSSSLRPCRDPAARIAMADSDGDGRDDLVIWSSVLESPVAFSITTGEGLSLDPADIFWLPWSEPYGDMRYVQGTNFMTAGDDASRVDFYESRVADLDGDGSEESVYTGTNCKLLIRDLARRLSVDLADAGAPLEVYDMNTDGLPEIIVSTSRPPMEGDALTFYNYTPDGASKSWSVDDLPGGAISLAAGLLDGDELPDLVVILRPGVRAESATLIVMLTAPQSDAARGADGGNR